MKSNASHPQWCTNGAPTGVEHFGQRLKSVIGEQSVSSFAKGCGLCEASLRKYLKSGTMPGIDRVAAISAHTGRSLNWLITGKGDEFKDKHSQDTNRLSDEEISKWLGCIADALTVDDKIRIVAAFKQGGLSALFKPDLITSTQNKPKDR
ncbi:CI repressor protein [Serratia fonticola]|uniref:CI repressor protein n=1 Tax=Serratia fonticola TaxID=47917 RepID=UPI002DBB1B48|nr:CI repressor protein [Serratia fonticola]MEB7886247.1 helix-turn-helix domain-containing protein [Serratia fonticola]